MTPDSHVAANGWSARLYWLWILYNSVAFVVVLTAVAVLAWLGADVLHLELASSSSLVAVLVATLGAVLFGGVLGSLQWRVIRERVPVPRKKWIVANVGPALLGWLLVITPAVINAQESDTDVSGAFLLAASQTLALGPLLGLSQAKVLRAYTRRWTWWIAANIVSWIIVDGVFYLLSQWFDALHSPRRLRRAGVHHAHRQHTTDRPHAPVGAGAVGGPQTGTSNPRPAAGNDVTGHAFTRGRERPAPSRPLLRTQ